MGYVNGPTLHDLSLHFEATAPLWEWRVPPSTAGHPTEECGHCGKIHACPCPRIKAIEYFESGVIRRVEYHDEK